MPEHLTCAMRIAIKHLPIMNKKIIVTNNEHDELNETNQLFTYY